MRLAITLALIFGVGFAVMNLIAKSERKFADACEELGGRAFVQHGNRICFSASATIEVPR